eukprot:jgi/Chrzof1/8936/Cz03g29220.t1
MKASFAVLVAVVVSTAFLGCATAGSHQPAGTSRKLLQWRPIRWDSWGGNHHNALSAEKQSVINQAAISSSSLGVQAAALTAGDDADYNIAVTKAAIDHAQANAGIAAYVGTGNFIGLLNALPFWGRR